MTLFDNVFATYVRVYKQGYVHVEWEGTVCTYIRTYKSIGCTLTRMFA